MMIVNVAFGLIAEQLPDEWIRPTIDAHKSTGITILGLVLLRLFWRLGHQPPPLPLEYSRWERLGAHAAHAALYVLMFALPLSGWLHDSAWKDAATHPMTLYGTVPWPRLGFITSIEPVAKEHLHDLFGSWHTALGYVLYGLFTLHLAAVLKHQLVDRERELQRMSL